MKTTVRFALALWLLVTALTLPARGQYFFPDGQDVYRPSKDKDGKTTIEVNDGSGKATFSYHSTDAKDKFGRIIFAKGVYDSSPAIIKLRYGFQLAIVGGVGSLGLYDKPKFTTVPAKSLGTHALFAPLAVAAVEPPTVIPISNEADTLAVSPDGRYVVVLGTEDNEPQNTATPVSLVDVSLGMEVSKLVVSGRAGSYVYATVCDDGETVLAVVGPAIHRLKITAGALVDTGDALPLPQGAMYFLRVAAGPGSEVGVSLALFPPRLVTFSIPTMQLIDSVAVPNGELDGLAVSPDGTKVYSRGGYPAGEIDCFTLDPAPGALGHTAFLTIPNVSPAHIGIFGNALAVTPDGTQLLANEAAFPTTTDTPTPRTTLLFRTGDLVDGRKVRDFTALLAVPGSLGTTHSFNAAGTVVWRAAFTDGSTAIVRTVTP